MPRRWRVVGGETTNGIRVRAGREFDSVQEKARLSTGALLEEVELCGERLHYKLLEGHGPASGWVSLAVGGKVLVVKDKVEAGEEAVAPASGAESASDFAPQPAKAKNSWVDLDGVRALLTEETIRQLNVDRMTVLDGVLSEEEVEAVREESERFLEKGHLKESIQKSFGRTDKYTFVTDDRCDQERCPALSKAVHKLVGLGQLLHRKTFCANPGDRDNIPWMASLRDGCADLSTREMVPVRIPENAMLATYDGGGTCYPAHRDNALSDGSSTIAKRSSLESNARHLTFVLYLNDKDWAESDGGTLRCHLGAAHCLSEPHANEPDEGCPTTCKSQGGICHRDVVPIGGRLVIFFSREILHEVRPSFRRRWAISLWAEDGRIPVEDPEKLKEDFAMAMMNALIAMAPKEKQADAYAALRGITKPRLPDVVDLKKIDVREPLLLLGTPNKWEIPQAQSKFAFTFIEHGSSENLQESRVMVPFYKQTIEFQIISARKFWNWRLYPSAEDKEDRELQPNNRNWCSVALAMDADEDAIHGRNFKIVNILRDIEVRVSISRTDRIRVWYKA